MRQLLLQITLFLGLVTPFTVRADETIAQGLTLKIPSTNQENWATLFKEYFAKPISSHDHTGGGKGLQLGAGSLQANALNDTNFRLTNNAYLRARNFANSADLNLIKADTSNVLRFSSVGANSRADLGLAIGADVQPYSSNLSNIAALTPGTGNFVTTSLGSYNISSASTARSTLGLGALATITSTPTNGQLPIGNGTDYTLATLTGTANRVTVTNGSGSITLSGPQDLASGSTPTFTGVNLSDDVNFSKSNAGIHSNTSDASDNKSVTISGGGGGAATRGAYAEFFGNEGSAPGELRLHTGDGQALTIETTSGAGGGIIEKTAGLTRWTTDASGNKNGDATNGGDIVFARAGKGVNLSIDTAVVAAGSSASDATLLTKRVSYATATGSNQGLKLFATIPVGGLVRIMNVDATRSIIIYPNTGHTIGVASSVTVSALKTIELYGSSSTVWLRVPPLE